MAIVLAVLSSLNLAAAAPAGTHDLLSTAAPTPADVESAAPAAAAKRYTLQKIVQMNCAAKTKCVGLLPLVPANELEVIQFVSCYFYMDLPHSLVVDIVETAGGTGVAGHYLASDSPGAAVQTISQAVVLSVRPKRRLAIEAFIGSGTLGGTCTVAGQLYAS